MPYSSPLFDQEIQNLLRTVNTQCVLDIGAGSGKYGTMAKKLDSKIYTAAVEIDSSYIEQFNLKTLYDEVWLMPAGDLITPKYYNHFFDVVIIGDTLEHLKKSEGIDLLNFLIYRSRWIILQYPDKYLQNIWEGHSAEAHISAWCEADFAVFEKTQVEHKEDMRLVALRGYLEKAIPLETARTAITSTHST